MYTRKFTETICVKGGVIDGIKFEEGEIYPLLGWNNGDHLMVANSKGDVKDILLHRIDSRLISADPNQKNTSALFKEVI